MKFFKWIKNNAGKIAIAALSIGLGALVSVFTVPISAVALPALVGIGAVGFSVGFISGGIWIGSNINTEDNASDNNIDVKTDNIITNEIPSPNLDIEAELELIRNQGKNVSQQVMVITAQMQADNVLRDQEILALKRELNDLREQCTQNQSELRRNSIFSVSENNIHESNDENNIFPHRGMRK